MKDKVKQYILTIIISKIYSLLWWGMPLHPNVLSVLVCFCNCVIPSLVTFLAALSMLHCAVHGVYIILLFTVYVSDLWVYKSVIFYLALCLVTAFWIKDVFCQMYIKYFKLKTWFMTIWLFFYLAQKSISLKLKLHFLTFYLVLSFRTSGVMGWTIEQDPLTLTLKVWESSICRLFSTAGKYCCRRHELNSSRT